MNLKRKILCNTAYLATFAAGFLAGGFLVKHNREELSRYERSCIAIDQIDYAEKIRQAYKGENEATKEAINRLENTSMRNLLALANELGPLCEKDYPLVWRIERYTQKYSITLPPEIKKICDAVQPEPPSSCTTKE